MKSRSSNRFQSTYWSARPPRLGRYCVAKLLEVNRALNVPPRLEIDCVSLSGIFKFHWLFAAELID